MIRDQKIICPSCKGSVGDFIVDQRLTVNHCIRCGKLWLDPGEEQLMLGAGISDQLHSHSDSISAVVDDPTKTDEQQLNCPRCENSRLSQRIIQKSRYWRCDTCSGHLFDLATVQKIKKMNQAKTTHIARSAYQYNGKTEKINPVVPQSGFLFHSAISRFAIPVVALLALLFVKMGGGIVLYLTGMIIHEIGHSAAGWLSGIPNIITPVMVWYFSFDTVYAVSIFLMAVFLWMFFLWIRKIGEIQDRIEFYLIALFLLALFLAQLFCSFSLSPERKYLFFNISGLLGEFAISAFFVIIFCFRSIPFPRWDFWRYPIMIYGMVHFVYVWLRWSDIFADHSLIPWGSAVSSDVGDGDLAKLRDVHGFTPDQILKVIAQTRRICLALILAGLVSLFLRRDGRFSADDGP